MAKPRISVSQKKRIILLNGMLQQARRRRKIAESIIQVLAIKRMLLIKSAMFLFILVTAEKCLRPRLHSCRRLQRNTGWWDLIWASYSESRFKKTFR